MVKHADHAVASRRCTAVAPTAQVDSDDLPVLVDRPVAIVPPLGDRDRGRVNAPAPIDWGAVCPCRRDETWGEGAHPVGACARVDVDAAFGQPRHPVRVAEPIPEIPAYGEGDHRVEEAVAVEGGTRARRDATPT